MLELLISTSIIVVLATAGWVYRFVPWIELLRGGAYLIVVGVLLSVLGGAVYHLLLFRALNPRGALGRRWYWNPTAYHGALLSTERGVVLPWFYLGAAAFGVVMLGCISVLLAVLRSAP